MARCGDTNDIPDDNDVLEDYTPPVILEILLVANGPLYPHGHLTIWGDGLRFEGCYVCLVGKREPGNQIGRQLVTKQ